MKNAHVNYTAPFFAQSFKPGEVEAWRFVRDEGGYWTAAELMAAMRRPGSSYRIAAALQRLAGEGYLVRKMRGEVWAYGVTARCYVPEGECMAPVDARAPALSVVPVVCSGGAA